MTTGKRERESQQELWIPAQHMRARSNPFYERLNQLLREAGFDDFVEDLVRPFYSTTGRPGLAAGIYFRMLMVGYFEGIASERGIDWRCGDSLSLRRFLGVPFSEDTPDHSTLSKTRKRLPLEVHQQAFDFILQLLAQHGLLQGEGLAIDATALHANAAMDSLVRRDGGEDYRAFLTRLAKDSGIETPTLADLKRIDRKRKKSKKTKNDDWHNPHDPDAKVKKTPRHGTRLTYKAENAVDTDSGAVLAAVVHPGDAGDTKTIGTTLEAANSALGRLIDACPDAPLPGPFVAADKGYHSGAVLTDLEASGFEPVISEPDRGRRKWTARGAAAAARKREERDATYRNRNRRRTARGGRLRRKRAEHCERTFARLLHTGGLRRVHVRDQENVQKRYLLQAAAHNISLLMRRLCGIGTPRSLQGAGAALVAGVVAALWALLVHLDAATAIISRAIRADDRFVSPSRTGLRQHHATA